MFNRKIKEQLEALQEENHHLKQQLQTLQQRFEKVETEGMQKRVRLIKEQQKLQEEKACFEAEKQDFESKKQAWLKKFQIAKITLQNKHRELQEQAHFQSDAQQKQSLIKQRIQQGMAALAKLKQRYQLELSQWQQQKRIWIDEQAVIKEQNEKNLLEKHQIEQALNQQKSWYQQYQTQIATLIEQLAQKQQQKSALSQELQALQKQLAEQQSECALRQQQAEKETVALDAQLNQQQQQKLALSQELQSLYKQLAEQRSEYTQRQQQIAQELTTQQESYAALWQQYEEDISTLSEKKRQLQQEIAILSQKRQQLAEWQQEEVVEINIPITSYEIAADEALKHTLLEEANIDAEINESSIAFTQDERSAYLEDAAEKITEPALLIEDNVVVDDLSELAKDIDLQVSDIKDNAALDELSEMKESVDFQLSDNEHFVWQNRGAETPFRQWLRECLHQCGLDAAPDKRPLYAYKLSDEQYQALIELMKREANPPNRLSDKYRDWAACYCLAASELYRREYDLSDWSWEFFDKRLGIRFESEPQRYEILERGLQYWQRPLKKYRSKRRQFLGTVFVEGGLPVKFLLAEDNKFSALIEHGLKHYHERLKHSEIILCLKEKRADLPQVFQSDDALAIFAHTVQVLAHWAQRFDLVKQENAVEYLDREALGWRDSFPFALPEKQADDLINHWLGSAAQAQEETLKQSFTCHHYIEEQDFTLTAQLSLPQQFTLRLKDYQGSTRLQWQFFEGEMPLENCGGILYASLDNNELTVKLPQKILSFKRSQSEQLLSLRFFVDGCLLHSEVLPDSAFDAEAPLWFAQGKENKWWLFSDNEYVRLKGEYRVCLPVGFKLEEEALYEEDNGALWYQRSDELLVENADGRQIIVEKRFSLAGQTSLRGKVFDDLTDKNGRQIYLGWPKVESPSEWGFTHWKLKGMSDEIKRPDKYGSFQATCYSNKTSLLRRHLTVLPHNFSFYWKQSADQKQAAILVIIGRAEFVEILAESCKVTEQDGEFEIRAKADDYPEKISLRIGSDEDCTAELILSLPYNGAYLYDEKGKLESRNFALNELMGKRILLSVADGKQVNWWVSLEKGVEDSGVVFLDNNRRAEINLYALKPIFLRLLSCSACLDARLKLSISVFGETWLELFISRYRGLVLWNNQAYLHGCLVETEEKRQNFNILEDDGSISHQAIVKIMRLDDLEQPEQRLYQDYWEKCYKISIEDGRGLWLIYPDAKSSLPFCPSLFANAPKMSSDEPIDSLSQALLAYHFEYSPDVIKQLIEQMAIQPSHESWCYFERLRKEFAHLPLSVFETWKALAQQPQALALAVLRLNLDESFCTRIRQELGVIWECLPIAAWRQALSNYRVYWAQFQQRLAEQGVFEVSFPENPIPQTLLCNSTLLQQYVNHGRLSIEEEKALTEKIIAIARRQHNSAYNRRYNELRQRDLPKRLNVSLWNWLKQQENDDFFKDVRALSKDSSDYALVWLPVLIALIKVGKASFEDIMQFELGDREVIAEFYRVYEFAPDWFDELCSALTCWLLLEE